MNSCIYCGKETKHANVCGSCAMAIKDWNRYYNSQITVVQDHSNHAALKELELQYEGVAEDD